MFSNSSHIVDQDAHHGATLDGTCYIFTCYIIPERPEAWQHDDVRVQFKHIDIFAGIAQAQPNKPMASIFG